VTTHRPRVEPSADFREVAHRLQELFTALRQSGFTERQALDLVGQALRGLAEGADPEAGAS
jgi:hypothetical protein